LSAPTASPDVRAALDALRRIVQALRRHGRSRSNISTAQRFALQQIADHPGASVNDVAAMTFTHQSSVSVVVQRLVERRLVAKTAVRADRRRQSLAPTKEGWRVLRRQPAPAQQRLIAAIAALPARTRRTLARSLGDIARSVVPTGAAAYPPMFFEEGLPRNQMEGSSSPRNRKRGRSRQGLPFQGDLGDTS